MAKFLTFLLNLVSALVNVLVLMTLIGHARVAPLQVLALAPQMITPMEQRKVITCILKPHFQESQETRQF